MSVTATLSSVVVIAGRNAPSDGSGNPPSTTPPRGPGDVLKPSPTPHGDGGTGRGDGQRGDVGVFPGVCGRRAELGNGEKRTCMPVHLGRLSCGAEVEVGDDRSTVRVSRCLCF